MVEKKCRESLGFPFVFAHLNSQLESCIRNEKAKDSNVILEFSAEF